MPSPPGALGVLLDAEVIERTAFEDHVRETVRITVEPGWSTDVYVLVPHGRGSGPWPGALCLHGHGRGKDDLVGIDRGDPQRRATIDALHEDYALRYVRRGYVTATIGMRLIGDRGLARGAKRRDPCDNAYFQATMFGRVPAALDAWDARRVLDLLASRPEVARDAAGPRLGCVGLSYGGRATMYVAALDERVRVAVVSGALNCFRERLVSFTGCGSQFVTGLFRLGDTGEVLASIAPRPLLLELGSRDGTSPAIFAEDLVQTIAQAYTVAHAPDRLALDLFEGEHWFSGRLADAWLDRWL
ncbi:MAG TPA: alpha/beta hydrolase family protein [Dehalococcoidia bacterium]